jgi:transposase
MDVITLQQQLDQQRQLNQQLQRDNAAAYQEIERLQAQLAIMQTDFRALMDSTEAVAKHRDQLEKLVAEVKATNKRLQEMLWGRRTERRTYALNQPLLPNFPGIDEPPAETPDVIIAGEKTQEELDLALLAELRDKRDKRRKERGNREEFPAHLERRERVIDLPEEQRAGLIPIGEDVMERMCFKWHEAYIERIVRRKYVKQEAAQSIIISPPPPLAITSGCKYDFSVIAAVLTNKAAFHLPTYRQQDVFGQLGWFPSRSTLNDLINVSVMTLEPLFEQLKREILRQPIVLTDDTRIRLLTRDALSAEQQEQLARRKQDQPQDEEDTLLENVSSGSGSATSFAWIYAGLDSMAPYQVFCWSLTRQHSVVDAHLAAFSGIVVGDGYDGYTTIAHRSRGRIVHAGCNAHARREFTKAEAEEPILSAQAISFYRQLYAINDREAGLSIEQRYALRQREAVPIWHRFESWLRAIAARETLPKSQMCKAVNYVLNHLQSLQRYLYDARLPIDNNASEQGIRPLTIGRKNWLFLGHPDAAPGRLQLMSIVSSAVRHNLVVYDYLLDVLTKLADARQNHPELLQPDSEFLRDLLPDRWAMSHPNSVQKARIDERQQVADRKRLRRATKRQRDREAARAAAAN